jgi:transcriptional regulator with XRE-family HTH domain
LSSDKNDEKRKPSDELLTVLAENVRRLREARGLTQEALGEACDFHPTFISLIERKQRNVTISTLEIIAKAFDVDVYELLQE